MAINTQARMLEYGALAYSTITPTTMIIIIIKLIKVTRLA